MRSDPKRCLELSERFGRLLVVAALFALPLVGGGACAPSDQVELRLFPCMVGDEQPRSVLVEITGYDAAGEVVETFETAFDNIAESVFEDGYATVGYHPDDAVVTADFRLGWSSSASIGSISEAEREVVLSMLAVPEVGQVLELGDGAGGGCEPIAGDGDGDMTGDGDGDMSGDGDGDMTGDGDGDMSGDGDGDMTGDGDGDMTGDGDGDMTGDGDGDMTGDGDGDMTGDGDGDPVDLPMAGDDCTVVGIPFGCIPAPNDQAGTPLLCMNGQFVETDAFVGACGFCPNGTSPVDACAGFGMPGYCLCLPDQNPVPCGGAQLGCDGDQIDLCFGGNVVSGDCPNCATEGEFYTCEEL